VSARSSSFASGSFERRTSRGSATLKDNATPYVWAMREDEAHFSCEKMSLLGHAPLCVKKYTTFLKKDERAGRTEKVFAGLCHLPFFVVTAFGKPPLRRRFARP